MSCAAPLLITIGVVLVFLGINIGYKVISNWRLRRQYNKYNEKDDKIFP